MKPVKNVKSEVNSTFGGLGDICIDKQITAKTLMRAIFNVFLFVSTLDGLSIQIYKFLAKKKYLVELWERLTFERRSER